MAFFISLMVSTRLPSTIIGLALSGDRVIVAADSRVTSAGHPAVDHSCKVTQLDTVTFFSQTGRTGLTNIKTGASGFDAAELSKRAFADSSTPNDRFTIVRIAANWAELTREKIEELWSHADTSNIRPYDTLLDGIFGRADSGSIRIYSVGIVARGGRSTRETRAAVIMEQLLPGNPIRFFGDDAAQHLAAEYLADRTPRSIALNAKFRERFNNSLDRDYDAHRLQSALEAAIEWGPGGTIGGSVDTMILERRGGNIRWISLKPECSQQPEGKKNTRPKR